MSCLNNKDRLSAFLDGALSKSEHEAVATHLVACQECSKEVSDLQKINELLEFSNVEPLELDGEFTKNVMARVRVLSPKRDIVFSSKRFIMFASAIVLYIVYVLSVTKTHDIPIEKIELSRNILFFNVFLAGMALTFVFFSVEIAGLNNRLLQNFSDKYKRISLSDIWVSRLVGLSIFMGLLTFKFVYAFFVSIKQGFL